MSRKATIWFAVCSLSLVVLMSGCGPQGEGTLAGAGQKADLKLQYAVGDTASYRVESVMRIDYKFEQPSLNKSDVKQTGHAATMEFTQEIESVQEDGSAVAKITIDEVKYTATTKNKVNFDFDSSRAEDKNKPFANIIGKSYKLKLFPDGNVEVIDASAARGSVKSGYGVQVVKVLLGNERLVNQHKILALPNKEASSVFKVGQSWEELEASHPGLKWAQKSFAKTYTLTEVSNKGGSKVAKVEMEGTESAEAADGTSRVAGMGMMAGIFDPTESFTGHIVLKDGKVESYSEKFSGAYVAAEMPANASDDASPDTLTMGFTNSIDVEKID